MRACFLFILSFFAVSQLVRGQEELSAHKWLQRLQGRPVRGQQVWTSDAHQAQRQQVRQRTVAAGLLPDSVGPLLPDQWDQEGALRCMTPILDGEHCVVGCVALAMAQVMHKWQHPERGTGSFTYVDSLGCGQVLTADFGQHRYDWANMLDKYVEGEYTQEQAEAGALLCSDCGISVRMKYGTSSGAQPVWQAVALPQYFGYDDGVQIYFRDFYTRQEITLMLKQELAAGRPVLISGYNHNGGHAFVIDGYNSDDWFHINVGNPDKEYDGDGWTPLDCMAPNQPTWYDVDSPESGLNLLQVFVMGVVPATDATATHTETHVFAMQRMEAVSQRAGRGDSLQVCVRDLSNIGRSLHHDSVSIVLLHDGEVVRPLYTYQREFLLEEVDDTTYTDTLGLVIPVDIGPGEYALQPMFRERGEWEMVRTSTGTPNYLLLQVEADSVALRADTAATAYLTLEDYDIPDLLINATCPDISITLKANNVEISGRIYLLMEPLDEGGKEFYLAQQGVAMGRGEVSVRRFHKTRLSAPRAGNYRLHFLYDNNLFADDLIELADPIDVTVLHAGSIQIAQADE